MRTALIESRNLTEQPTAVRRGTMTPAEMPTWFPKAFGEVAEFLRLHAITPAGPPFARYHMLPGGYFEVESGYPVPEPVRSDGTTQPSTLPGGPAAVTVHVGPYDRLGSTYETLTDWLMMRGATPSGAPWEIYHDPPHGDPTTWHTAVVQPYCPAVDLS